MLVDTLSDEWGSYRTLAGKAVYFTLAFQPGPPEAANAARGGTDVGTVSQIPPRLTVPTQNAGPAEPTPETKNHWPNGAAFPWSRLPRRDVTQGRLPGDVDPGVDVELLEDVGDVGCDGPPG